MLKTLTPDDAVAWAAALVGCPNRYLHCTFNSWQGLTPERVLQWAKGAEDEGRWCLTFLGLPGRGKTHLATAAFNLRVGERMVWPGATRMGSFWMAARHLPDIVLSKTESVGSLADYGFMLIDDIGRGDSALARDLTVQLLLDRYDRKAKTILTVNAEAIGEVDALDPALTSRLCDGDIVRLAGADYRMKR